MLGHKAVDKITGLKGIITATAEFLHSPVRIELTPMKIVDGKPQESVWLDETRLDISSKPEVRATESVPTIKLGDEATDPITKFKGVATARFKFLNGCLRVELTPRERDKKSGKPIEPHTFDEQRLNPKSKVATGGPFDGPPAFRRP